MSDKIKQYYEEYYQKGGLYNMSYWKHTSRVSFLIQFLTEHVKPGGKILDVGCGDMYLSTELTQYDWTGIDINIEKAKGRAVKHLLENTPYPFPDQSFDAVVCSEVLEHIFDPLTVSKEIRRLLKPDGIYVLSTPNHNYIDHHLRGFKQIVFNLTESWTKEHIHQYTVDSHKEILEASGFKLHRYTGADAHFSGVFGAHREPLRVVVEKAYGDPDLKYVITDQIIGAMFPDWNHTIVIEARPI